MANVGNGLSGKVLTGTGSQSSPSFSSIGTNSGLTAHGVILGQGSSAFTATGAGIAGQVLKSNGPSADPSFQSGGTYQMLLSSSGTVTSFNPLDATTYYLAFGQNSSTSLANVPTARLYIPSSGTITACVGTMACVGTGSNENVTIAIRLNDTTNTNVTTTLQMTAQNNPFSNTGLSISVSVGDFITLMMITPTWATNPTSVGYSVSFYIQ